MSAVVATCVLLTAAMVAVAVVFVLVTAGTDRRRNAELGAAWAATSARRAAQAERQPRSACRAERAVAGERR